MPAPLPHQEADAGPAGSAGSAGHRRLDIQGLRAVAVLVVVAFHAGLPVPGGFVGVDVFFVISGFVITAMLRREHATTGRISFVTFYRRRFVRLLPALSVMVAVVLLASTFLLSPLGSQQIASATGAGAMLVVANLVVARTTGGYFGSSAELNPLLNTWSLSVEEQFYLLFPALLLAGWAIAARARHSSRVWQWSPLVIVSGVAVASFALAVLGSLGYRPSHGEYLLGFYSPVNRAWEFAAGALIALAMGSRRRLPAAVGNVAGLLGAALLAASLWLISERTPMPGVWTLAPVLATVLIIVSGFAPENVVSRGLSRRPLVKVGDWSYSIYLWHWPLIVFAACIWPLSPAMAIPAAALAFVPALLSYRFVEQPVRRQPRRTLGRGAVLAAVVLIPPIVLAISTARMADDYWTPAYEQSAALAGGEVGHAAYFAAEAAFAHACTEPISTCKQSAPGGPSRLAIIGDSHGEHLFPGFALALPDENVISYEVNLHDVVEPNPGLARILADPAITTVVVNGYWGESDDFEAGLSALLDKLVAAGKDIFLANDGPEFPFGPVICKYRTAPVIDTSVCASTDEQLATKQQDIDARLRSMTAAMPAVTVVDTWHTVCSEQTCDMSADGDVLYRDRNHLNIDGSRLVVDRLLRDTPRLAASETGAG